ncbi:hypothetical protein SAMN04488074_113192 [Lentzea albidocapillata subsp. violacea]|uniref:Uncharacterized protein n=1 Tax=Lentzea albidocapillata subsp. violacea TaxID=128104 RepID=A0A1G9N0S8_9PSEU|nr:hypothetical protein [Lentzea albidocapillata]SDL80079.1 hypothetical protein SAMN04488074_113192 [Lentzea albidocapillata subsp. violacea]
MARVFISHATQNVVIATLIRDLLDRDHESFLKFIPTTGFR